MLIICCTTTQYKKANAEDWAGIISNVLSWGFGDGLMKSCADFLECDEYEDTSLSDQVTGLFSSNKKNFTCAASNFSKNAIRVGGTIAFSAIPPPFNYMIANFAGESVQCIQAIIQSDSVQKKVGKYELCYGDSSEGHPMPLTDKQIAKVLPKMNLWPTVENIVAQYPKLCVKKTGDEDSYRFYGDGDYFDGVYIHHANDYAYVMCASLFEACPCVYNIQRGKINDPEYNRDENGMIKIRHDGSLVYKGDDENSRKNEEEYKSKYAKHCRLVRFKEVYEQADDISSIYSDACFDLHGYSKRQANITAGIVQCFEDTARNIFEKPILSVKQNAISGYNSYDIYVNDYQFIEQRYNKIQNLLQGRTEELVSSNNFYRFLPNETSGILQLLQEIWYKDNSTTTISFACKNHRAINSNYKTNIYDKYIFAPAKYSADNCCSNDTEVSSKCYSDAYSGAESNIKPSISKDQQDIDVSNMFKEINKVNVLMEHVKSLELKASEAESVKIKNSGFTLTLFDLLRGKIKVIAVIVLVFWVFLFGWKIINGDSGKISTKELSLIALKISLCYMVVFSDAAKNLIFNFAIQTSHGVGLFFNDVMEGFRSQQDNKYNHVCNMRSNSISTPKKTYGDVVIAKSIAEKKYTCQPWEEKVCNNSGGVFSCSCYEYKMSCSDKTSTLNCSDYYEDYNGVENKNYCKTGSCATKDGYAKANIYKTGVQRKADEYSSYTFECPSDTEDDGCAEYETYFGNKQCVRKNCKKFTLSCNAGETLSCKRYSILADGSYGSCISGVCTNNKTTFVLMPPLERPYKVKSYYTTSNEEHKMTYQPYCHKKTQDNMMPNYLDSDPLADLVYSSAINANVFACDEEHELDDGFRIKEYIRHGIIPDTNESILVFQSLLPKSKQSYSDDAKVSELKKMPVPTAVATTDSHGMIKEYNFIDDEKASEGFQRAKYRIYIKSLLSYVNKNSSYPKIKEYGYTRDYSHLSFWDSMDCKIIQFISLQGMDGGFTEDINDVISGAQSSDSGKMVKSALNGMLQLLKFMFMAFPFGILVFILMFGIGAALFMLVARATQQYCICVFHLVLLVYLSPFIFLLWLFDKTKHAMDTWLDDMKNNIFGACVPFVSISMFLFIIDWLLFGDTSKYVSMGLFLPSGEISDSCYEGNLSDAPIACLSKRCLKTFTWVGLLGLNQGISLYTAEAYKMLGYLVLRCLFASAVIIAMTSLLDKMEEAIYNIIGSKPSMEIDAGFTGSAKDAIKSIDSGLTATKFVYSSANLAARGGVGLIGGGVGVIGSLMPKAARDTIKNQWEGFKSAVNYVPNKIQQGYDSVKKTIRHGVAKTFNTKSWRDHQNRLNDIENAYNNSISQQQEIRDRKIQQIRDRSLQQQRENASIIDSYVNNLTQQNVFNQQQIEALKAQKETELTNQINRLTQDGINSVNQEFDNAQREILRTRDANKKNENDNF